MRTKVKQLLSVFLVASMLFSADCMPVYATENEEIESYDIAEEVVYEEDTIDGTADEETADEETIVEDVTDVELEVEESVEETMEEDIAEDVVVDEADEIVVEDIDVLSAVEEDINAESIVEEVVENDILAEDKTDDDELVDEGYELDEAEDGMIDVSEEDGVYASKSMKPENALVLSVGGNINRSVSSGEVIWVKVNAKSYAKTKTHIVVSTSGVSTAISGYYNLTKAKKGSTFKEYSKVNDTLAFPIAWSTSYYYFKIKAKSAGTLAINGDVTNKRPELPKYEDDFCTSEAIALGNDGILSSLEGMRSVRDNVLSRSAYGQQLSNYYYSISTQVVAEMFFNSAFRDSMSEKATEILPVIKEFIAISNGQPTGYVLTQEDYDTIVSMKNDIFSNLSEKNRTLGENLWNTLSLGEFVGHPFQEAVEVKLMTNVKMSDMSYCECIVYYNGSEDVDAMLAKANNILASNGINVSLSARKSDNLFGTEQKYIIQVNGFADESIVCDILAASNYFEKVEANYEIYSLTSDINYEYEWHLKNVGQSIPVNKDGSETNIVGKKGADIKFESMRKYLKGKKTRKVKVAVIDTGINYTLADFKGRVDYANAYNFVKNNTNPMDDNNHGTHVSGIIAAKCGNNYSMAGICADAVILPIKVLDANGSGNKDNLSKAIKYAADKGAKVINLSLGMRKSNGDPIMPSECTEVEEALKYARKKGVTIVVAAGNESKNNLSYPANSSYVLSVGAIDNKDNLASFTNTGKGLNLVAPGVSIASLVKNGQVSFMSGTSMACPVVTGVVAEMYAVNSKMTPKKVKKILKTNSRDLGKKGYDTKYGYGCVNAYKAVVAAKKCK